MKREDYNRIKKKTDRNHSFISHYVMRPVSRVMVYYFSKIGIKPEQVVLISIFFSIIGAGLLIFNNYYLTIAAFLVLFFRNILDCVDGDLARYTNRVTARGALSDEFADRINDLLICAALGYSLFLKYQNMIVIVLVAYYAFIYLSAVNIGLKVASLSYPHIPNKKKSFFRMMLGYGGENNILLFLFFSVLNQLLYGVIIASFLTSLLVIGRFIWSFIVLTRHERKSK